LVHRIIVMKVSGRIVFLIAALTAMILSSTGASAKEEVRLLVLGDSLAAGYGLPSSQAFTTKLQAALTERGHAVRIINAGVSGDTTAGGLARMDWVMGDKPQAAILELGANDGLRGLDVGAMRANLTAILNRFDKDGVSVLLAGMKAPPNYGGDYFRAYEKVFTDLAKEYPVIFYPFFLEGAATLSDLNQQDGIHPNAKGVEIIVRNILPAVEQLLARVKAAG
jgi:acyl-CoA thioesterase-1